jgi:hypothetical protein
MIVSGNQRPTSSELPEFGCSLPSHMTPVRWLAMTVAVWLLSERQWIIRNEFGDWITVDGLPILEHFERADWRFARDWYHWFFFAQPERPERAILADPIAWYSSLSPI